MRGIQGIIGRCLKGVTKLIALIAGRIPTSCRCDNWLSGWKPFHELPFQFLTGVDASPPRKPLGIGQKPEGKTAKEPKMGRSCRWGAFLALGLHWAILPRWQENLLKFESLAQDYDYFVILCMCFIFQLMTASFLGRSDGNMWGFHGHSSKSEKIESQTEPFFFWFLTTVFYFMFDFWGVETSWNQDPTLLWKWNSSLRSSVNQNWRPGDVLRIISLPNWGTAQALTNFLQPIAGSMLQGPQGRSDSF